MQQVLIPLLIIANAHVHTYIRMNECQHTHASYPVNAFIFSSPRRNCVSTFPKSSTSTPACSRRSHSCASSPTRSTRLRVCINLRFGPPMCVYAKIKVYTCLTLFIFAQQTQTPRIPRVSCVHISANELECVWKDVHIYFTLFTANSDTTKDVTRVYNVLSPQPADLLEPHRRFKMEVMFFFF